MVAKSFGSMCDYYIEGWLLFERWLLFEGWVLFEEWLLLCSACSAAVIVKQGWYSVIKSLRSVYFV